MEMHILDWIIYFFLIILSAIITRNESDNGSEGFIAWFAFTFCYCIIFSIYDWMDLIRWLIHDVSYSL